LSNFCPECGNKLISSNAEICPNCGVRLKPNSEKSPGIAALCSFLFPGLGQVYNGSFGRGALILLGTLIGLCLFTIPGLIVYVYSIYDAYTTAKRMNAGEILYQKTNLLHMILFVILAFFMFILLAAIVAAFVFGMTGAASDSIDEWNAVVDIQEEFDAQAYNDIESLGNHLDDYNSEIGKTYPNYNQLIRNFQSDRSKIAAWDSYLSQMDVRLNSFARVTAGYSGNEKQYADEMLSGLRDYYNHMSSAELGYIKFCDDMVLYLETCRNGYPEDSLINSANSAKDEAYKNTDLAYARLSSAQDSATRMEQLQ